MRSLTGHSFFIVRLKNKSKHVFRNFMRKNAKKLCKISIKLQISFINDKHLYFMLN